jgi:hypothetical protein
MKRWGRSPPELLKKKEEVALSCDKNIGCGLLMRSSKVGASPPWEANAKQQELVQEEPCMETLGARPKHGHGAVASIGALSKNESMHGKRRWL